MGFRRLADVVGPGGRTGGGPARTCHRIIYRRMALRPNNLRPMTISTGTFPALDPKDRKILELVQRDGRMPQSEIARQVQLSTAAVNERLRKLEAAGFIRHTVA